MAEQQTLTLDAECSLVAASDSKSPQLPKIQIVAYRGGKMRPSGGWGDVVIDLTGVAIPAASGVVPILANHDHSSIIGHATVLVDSAGIHATGVVSGGGPAAQEFVTAARNGFPWKASVGLSVAKSTFLKNNETATINAVAVTGPITVVERSLLGEISVLPWPADQTSSVTIAAKQATSTEASDMDETTNTIDELRAREAAETERIAEIRKVCGGGHSELEAEAIREGWNPTKVELEVLRAERKKAPAIHSAVGGPVASQDVQAAALLLHAGLDDVVQKEFNPRVCEAANGLRHLSVLDHAKESLRQNGVFTSTMSRNELLTAAFSTASLSNVLSNALNKSIAMAYREEPAAWRATCAIKTARSFQDHTSIRLTGIDDLEVVGAAGEVKHSDLADEAYTWSVNTFAKQIRITRQALINDDLSILSDVGQAMGRAALRTVSDQWATTLLANTSGGSDFFSSAHSNLLTGGGSALGASGLAAAVKALRQMKDSHGSLIDVQPRLLLVPPSLEFTAKALISSSELLRVTTDELPTGNPYQGLLDVVVDARLEDTGFTGYSATAWYVWSAPSNATMVCGFLDGVQSPTVEFFGMDSDVDTLGVAYRVHLDFGFALTDYRCAIKNAGA